MLTEQQLNELWELADKATPGPWCVAGVTHQWRICVHREDSNDCYEDHPLIWAEDDDHLACANGNTVQTFIGRRKTFRHA